MTKEDLKHGNVVETREGFRYFYINDKNNYYDGLLFNLDGKDFDLSINNYRDDLTCDHMVLHDLDIMKVYKDYTLQELLWGRKEKPKLTDVEKIILMNADKHLKYIARDKNGSLYVYQNKPIKRHNEYWGDGSCGRDFCFDHLFQFIKWEDDEPYLIEELLKDDQEDDK